MARRQDGEGRGIALKWQRIPVKPLPTHKVLFEEVNTVHSATFMGIVRNTMS